MPALGAEIARESPKTRKAFAAKVEQMIDMMTDQIPDVPRKPARKQAIASVDHHDGHAGAVAYRRQR